MGEVRWSRSLRTASAFLPVGTAPLAAFRLVDPDTSAPFRAAWAAMLAVQALLAYRLFRTRIEAGDRGITVRRVGRPVRLAWADVERFEADGSKWEASRRLRACRHDGTAVVLGDHPLASERAVALAGDLDAELARRTGRREPA